MILCTTMAESKIPEGLVDTRLHRSVRETPTKADHLTSLSIGDVTIDELQTKADIRRARAELLQKVREVFDYLLAQPRKNRAAMQGELDNVSEPSVLTLNVILKSRTKEFPIDFEDGDMEAKAERIIEQIRKEIPREKIHDLSQERRIKGKAWKVLTLLAGYSGVRELSKDEMKQRAHAKSMDAHLLKIRCSLELSKSYRLVSEKQEGENMYSLQCVSDAK